MPDIQIEQADPRAPGATALLHASHTLMDSLFAAGECHYLDIEDLCQPHIQFFVAKHAGNDIACIALADKGSYGEIKSLFVAPEARGLGTAEQLIQKVEAAAKAKSLGTLKLETGDALEAACRLYQRLGYAICGPFGDYVESPASVFMTKDL